MHDAAGGFEALFQDLTALIWINSLHTYCVLLSLTLILVLHKEFRSNRLDSLTQTVIILDHYLLSVQYYCINDFTIHWIDELFPISVIGIFRFSLSIIFFVSNRNRSILPGFAEISYCDPYIVTYCILTVNNIFHKLNFLFINSRVRMWFSVWFHCSQCWNIISKFW